MYQIIQSRFLQVAIADPICMLHNPDKSIAGLFELAFPRATKLPLLLFQHTNKHRVNMKAQARADIPEYEETVSLAPLSCKLLSDLNETFTRPILYIVLPCPYKSWADGVWSWGARTPLILSPHKWKYWYLDDKYRIWLNVSLNFKLNQPWKLLAYLHTGRHLTERKIELILKVLYHAWSKIYQREY